MRRERKLSKPLEKLIRSWRKKMATQNAKLKKQDSEDIVISMNGVNKWFGNFHVLRDINLNVRKGERIIICGPSGSGKSTVIRCLNALEHHQGGDINILGVTLDNNVHNVELIRRDVGMVFQQFNLFPHLSILENCILAPTWVKKCLAPKRLIWLCHCWNG